MSDLYFQLSRKFFPKLITSSSYLRHLRKIGIKIGCGTILYDASRIIIDESRPHLLSIGKYCKITSGTIILAHDYSRSVLRRKYGELIAEAEKTIIGDNVFIGMNSIILMGSQIGNNTIIGAGSVVSGQFSGDVVIAGNPAKIIMNIDTFYEKKKKAWVNAAVLYFNEFYRRYGKNPNIKEMNSFFPLYLERDITELKKHNLQTDLGGDREEDVINDFLKTSKQFKDFKDFENYCILKRSKL